MSITGGMKRTYVAHTGVNNQGRLDMLSEVLTDEPTGTEIQVAIKPSDSGEFKKSIQRACYFWKESERPEFRGVTKGDIGFHTPGLLLGKHLEVTKSTLPDCLDKSWSDSAGMVIDGVFYPITEKLSDKLTNVKSLVKSSKVFLLLHVGNGIVEVGANRESIADSEFTRESLNKITLEAKQEFVQYIKDQFKAVKTNAEWITTYKAMGSLAHVDDHSKYGNYKIEQGHIVSNDFKQIQMLHVTNNGGRTKVKLDRDDTYTMGLDYIDSVYYIDNADEGAVTQNRRIREYFETNRRGNLMLVSAKEITGFDHTQKDAAGQPLKVVKVSLADSKKVLAKLMKDFNAKPLSSLAYTPVFRVPKAKRDRTKEMFTIHTARWGGKSPETITLERAEESDNTYLYVKFDQYEKFKDEMADMYSYLSENNMIPCYLTEKSIEMVVGSESFKPYTDWKSEFSPGLKLINSVKALRSANTKVVKFLNRADSKIKDKHINKMLKEYDSVVGKSESIPETIQKIVSKEITSFIEDDKELTRIVKECYPLLEQVATDNSTKSLANEIVIYINAKN